MLYRSPSTKIITHIVTLTNARIWKPQIVRPGTEPLYTASVLIPKTDIKTNEGINLAINTAIRMGASLHRGKFAQAAKKNLPIHDGDSKGLNEIFRGYWVVNTARLTAPKILDHSVLPITDSSLVQPGCKIRVSLNFFPYPKVKSYDTGIGCMLGNIQKAFTRNDYEVLPDADFDLFTDEYLRVFLWNNRL